MSTSKKKMNKGFLIADHAITDLKIVSENVTVFTKNSGEDGFLIEVQQAGNPDTGNAIPRRRTSRVFKASENFK